MVDSIMIRNQTKDICFVTCLPYYRSMFEIEIVYVFSIMGNDNVGYDRRKW